MTYPQLRVVGEALFGPRWQSELARALGISDRHMRRWVQAGEIPESYQGKVRALISAKRRLLRSLR